MRLERTTKDEKELGSRRQSRVAVLATWVIRSKIQDFWRNDFLSPIKLLFDR